MTLPTPYYADDAVTIYHRRPVRGKIAPCQPNLWHVIAQGSEARTCLSVCPDQSRDTNSRPNMSLSGHAQGQSITRGKARP